MSLTILPSVTSRALASIDDSLFKYQKDLSSNLLRALSIVLNNTSATILTRIRAARIYRGLAVLACIAGRTYTHTLAIRVLTLASVLARVGRTWIYLRIKRISC